MATFGGSGISNNGLLAAVSRARRVRASASTSRRLLALLLCIAIATPPIASPAHAFDPDADLIVPESDRKAVDAAVKICGGNTQCLAGKLRSTAARARTYAGQAISALSPDLEFVISRTCPSNPSGGASAFAHTSLCQAEWLGVMSKGSKELSGSRSPVSRSGFESFLAKEKAQSPTPWYVAVYEHACDGSQAGYDCFRNRMEQMSRDAAVAAPSMKAYVGPLFRAMLLSEELCKADPSACREQGLQLKQVAFALDDPKRPKYRPRKPKPSPVPDAEKPSGSSGSEGASTAGSGKSAGGSSASATKGPGEGSSTNKSEGRGKGAVAGANGQSARSDSIPPEQQEINPENLPLVLPEDLGWEVTGPVLQCPEFLRPYNCMELGTGRAGDLTRLRDTPGFFPARERLCRKELKKRISPRMLDGLSESWGDPSKATPERSPGCDYLITNVKAPDPAPPLVKEEIDLARVSESGQLHGSLMNLADIVSDIGLKRDLGVYSVQQQALGLLQVQANLNPDILVHSGKGAYDTAVQEILGAASCLPPDDQKVLRRQMDAYRELGLAHSRQLSTQKADLERQWIERLTDDSRRIAAVNQVDTHLSRLWGQLRCDNNFLGDSKQCLARNYENISKPGAPVGKQTYETRLRWLKEDLVRALAHPGDEVRFEDSAWASLLSRGNPEAGQDPECHYISCSDLSGTVRALRNRRNELISRNPLLGEPLEGDSKSEIDTCGLDPKCTPPKILADRLAPAHASERKAAARAASRRVHAQGLENLRSICSKPGGLDEEGRHASGVQQITQGFMSCADIGEYSKRCGDRRSYGWALCRLHAENAVESNSRKYREMFMGMAMASGGALALVATFGGAGIPAAALGIGMSGSSVSIRYMENVHAENAADYARRDFRNRWKTYDEFRAAWNRMEEAQKYAVAGYAFDAISIYLDRGVLAHALRTAKAAGRVKALDDLIRQGKGAEAFSSAPAARGGKGSLEQVLDEAKEAGKRKGIDLHAELLLSIRRNLRPYGPRVAGLPENELIVLDRIEDRIIALRREGLIDDATAIRVRREVSDELHSPHGSLRRLSGEQIADLYLELQSAGRFSGAQGAARRKTFISLMEDSLRKAHPDTPDEVWRTLTQDDKIAILEGRLRPRAAHVARVDRNRSYASFPNAKARKNAAKAKAEAVIQDPRVQQLIERHRSFSRITDEDNARYLAAARNPDSEGRYLHFVLEMPEVQRANDEVIFYKGLVDSAVNLRAEAFLAEKIERNPVLGPALREKLKDYKGIRLAFEGDHERIARELAKVHEEAALEFARLMDSTAVRELYEGQRGMIGSSGNWFMAGVGGTLDEASSAARSARLRFREGAKFTPLQDFRQTESTLGYRFSAWQELRESLQQDFGSSSSILRTLPSGRKILSPGAQELLHKVPASNLDEYVTEVQRRFKVRFQTDLSHDQVLNLRDYVTVGEGFSPSLLLEKRVQIQLGEAKNGLLMADFKGQSVRNRDHLHAMLADLPADSPDIRKLIERSRASERSATAEMKEIGQQFRSAVARTIGEAEANRVLFSGDDGALMPLRALSEKEKAKLISELSQTRRPDAFRISYIPQKFADTGKEIPALEREMLVNRAESVEKLLRGTMEEKRIPYDRLKKMSIAVDLVPNESGDGVVRLIVGSSESPLDAQTLKAMKGALHRSLPKGYKIGDIVDTKKAEVTPALRPGAGNPKAANAPPPRGKESRPVTKESATSVTRKDSARGPDSSASRVNYELTAEPHRPPAPIHAKAEHHIFSGDFRTFQGRVHLVGGMHTQAAFDDFIQSQSDLLHATAPGHLPVRTTTLDNGVTRVYLPRRAMNLDAWKKAVFAAVGQGVLDDVIRVAGLDPTDPVVRARFIQKTSKGAVRPLPAEIPYAIKTLFPSSWSKEGILKAIQEVQQRGVITKAGERTFVDGIYDGVLIRVVMLDGKIQTAYPPVLQP